MNQPVAGIAMAEQRAFSPDEVAEMLGMGRTTVFDLLREGELGSTKIRGSRRIFLSDLEDFVGEERAHSLVRKVNREKEDQPEEESANGEDEEDPTG